MHTEEAVHRYDQGWNQSRNSRDGGSAGGWGGGGGVGVDGAVTNPPVTAACHFLVPQHQPQEPRLEMTVEIEDRCFGLGWLATGVMV